MTDTVKNPEPQPVDTTVESAGRWATFKTNHPRVLRAGKITAALGTAVGVGYVWRSLKANTDTPVGEYLGVEDESSPESSQDTEA